MTEARLRTIAAVVIVLAVLTGCSITSGPSNVDHMRCVKAHDEFHQTNGGGVTTICDEYQPEATP